MTVVTPELRAIVERAARDVELNGRYIERVDRDRYVLDAHHPIPAFLEAVTPQLILDLIAEHDQHDPVIARALSRPGGTR